jgi:hypothetical protein
MAQGYSAEATGVLDGTTNPAGKFDGRVVNAKLRASRATLDLSLAAVAKNSGDTNVLFRLPRGARPQKFAVNSSVSLGTATISIGNGSDAVKYKAAAVHTTTDSPISYMKAGAQDDAPLTDYEDVLLTIGTAALPGAGILVIECVYSAR